MLSDTDRLVPHSEKLTRCKGRHRGQVGGGQAGGWGLGTGAEGNDFYFKALGMLWKETG